ncbi:type VI secretion system tube protein TssD [Mucilaginibacter sp. PAMB04274]|uniref:type VI secretion system tube protein TssD n=1 Tax=Mucilaginibacter sp. PAMB04274 TaxID=3138568 RepID=UPI0031F6D4EA
MKTVFAFTSSLLLLFFATHTRAQTEESRTQIQMTIVVAGKNIVTDLNGVSTSLSRNYEETPVIATKDTSKSKLPGYYPAGFYLTLDAKKISDDLLRVLAKKRNRFDGTITIVDTYGKKPTRTIRFKQASLYSYSDQMSAAGYSDTYSAAAISISCQEVSINGIVIEQ